MKKYYRPKRRKETIAWGEHSPAYSSAPRRRSHRGRRLLLTVAACVVIVFALFQFNVLSWQSVQTGYQNATAAISGSYQEAVAWTRDKLGMETDVELALPVSSGVVVEEYGVVVNDAGEENYHSGVDIQVPDGSQILAAADGEVIKLDTRDDGTVWITVKHDDSWSTLYGRLGEAAVAVGDTVARGDVLGTPKSNILHFEVLEKERQKNPVGYFQ